jgi:hypothetical protein
VERNLSHPPQVVTKVEIVIGVKRELIITAMKQKLWLNITKELKDNIFNKNILKEFISEFYEKVVDKIEPDQHILFLFRVVLINDDIKTVSKLIKINKEGTPSTVIIYLLDAINLTSNNYDSAPIKSMVISYGIRKGEITPTIIEKKEVVSHHIFYNHKLPIALKAEDYGDVLYTTDGTTIVSLKKNTNLVIKTEGNISHIKYFKNGRLMYEWTDHIK